MGSDIVTFALRTISDGSMEEKKEGLGGKGDRWKIKIKKFFKGMHWKPRGEARLHEGSGRRDGDEMQTWEVWLVISSHRMMGCWRQGEEWHLDPFWALPWQLDQMICLYVGDSCEDETRSLILVVSSCGDPGSGPQLDTMQWLSHLLSTWAKSRRTKKFCACAHCGVAFAKAVYENTYTLVGLLCKKNVRSPRSKYPNLIAIKNHGLGRG